MFSWNRAVRRGYLVADLWVFLYLGQMLTMSKSLVHRQVVRLESLQITFK